EKVVVSWNGLMLAAFAEAARVLDGGGDLSDRAARYREVAERNADFLLRELRTDRGRLWHVCKGGEADVPGFLEDYAHLIEGLLALYQTTFAPRWYEAAAELAEEMVAHFRAEAGFYDTADDAEDLVVRPRELQDNAVPSGNAMAVTVLQKLARFGGGSVTGEETEAQRADYETVARRSLASMDDLPGNHPRAFGQWLVALDDALATAVEVAIIGAAGAQGTQALLEVAQEGYHPHRLVAVGTGDVPSLLAYRTQVDGKATAYVCRNHVCLDPIVAPDSVQERLA
ncbi:MAG: thioredoxin domain-containing protein, partial [Anaerolineae bacterium]